MLFQTFSIDWEKNSATWCLQTMKNTSQRNKQPSSTGLHFSTAHEQVRQLDFLPASKPDVGKDTAGPTQETEKDQTSRHVQCSVSGGSNLEQNEMYHDFQISDETMRLCLVAHQNEPNYLSSKDYFQAQAKFF